ncbi:MAG TPA: HD-GYP domain-containing protein [Pseudoduganella sp.]
MSKQLMPVPAERLELGMFIDSIGGAWVDSPFWRKSFLIEDTGTLARLRQMGAVECTIDLARGIRPSTLEGQHPAAPARHTAAGAAPRLSADAALREFAQLRQRAGESTARIFSELRLGRAIDNAECQALVTEIADATSKDCDAALALLRLKRKDEYTHLHSVAVCALMINLARQLDLPPAERQQAGMAGLLHDIGKVAIPLEILNKPGGLSDEEFAVVRSHPQASYEMLEKAGIDSAVRNACLLHHEKIDGSGYPKRLSGALIPLLARMCAICDVYDAITSNRPYKEGWDPAESISRMLAWKGHFDAAMLGKFVHSVGIYPAGALVRLRSGALAVVLRQNRQNLTKPLVFAMFDPASGTEMAREIDLLDVADSVAGLEDRQAWPGLDVDRIWQGYIGEGEGQ